MRLLLAALFALLPGAAWAVCPSPLTGKDAAGTTQNFGITVDGSGNCYGNIAIVDGTNAANKATVPASAADATSNTTPGVVTQGFGFLFNGATWDRWRGDTTNGAWVNVKTGTLSVTQSGTWTVQQGGAPWAVSQSGAPWSENITQFGGVALSTGTGASGTGIPRVTVSNDSNILATQSGTWTVQQGTPPWSVSQSGSWTVTVNAGTNLNTSALALETGGNLGQLATDFGAPGSVACATDTASCSLNQQVQRLAQRLTTINTTLGTPFQAGAALAANQSVNTAQINGVTPLMGNGITGTGSQRVTIASDNTAFTVVATQPTGTNLHIVCDSGCAGSGGTSSTFGAAFPAAGTAVGMSQGGNMVALTGTTGNLNVQCANCSGSGVSTIDPSNWVTATSIFAGGGGFFQTTATNNALTTGQQGMFQVTANRALFTNLRNAAGTEIGTAAAPLQVSVANTAANGTAMLVTGTGGTFPISGSLTANQSVNVSQINGVAPLMGNGVTGTGSQRVTIASDNTAFSVNATLSAETTKVIGTVNQGTSPWVISGSLTANQSVNVSQINGVTPLMGNGITGTGSQRVTIASDNTAFAVNATLQTGANVIGSLTANQSVNAAQINGVAPLMGNGVTGTGSQRVTIASDNTAFAVNATLQASAATAIGTVNPTTVGTWGLQTSTQNSATPTNGMLVLGQFNTAPTGIASGNVSALQLDTNGNLLVNIKAGAGSGGTAIADKAAWTVSSTTFTLTGGEFTTGGATACATAQACTVGMTAARAFFTDASSVAGTAILTGNGTTGAGSQRVTIASDNTAFAVNATLQTGANVIGSLTANQSVNVAQVNGVTPLMGNGVTGTGSQRVTIASDNTAFAVNATLQASSATAIGTVAPTLAGTWGLAPSAQNVTTPTNGMLVMGEFNTTPTTIATGNSSPLQLDTNGNLLVNIKAGAGSGGTAIADKAAWTVSSTTFTLTGGEFTTGGATACTTGQACTVGMTAARAMFEDISSIAGTATLTGNGVTGAGSQRVTIASDNTAFSVNATLQTGANVIGSLTANQSVNTAQVNGVTTLTGAGATGTGAQRVTVSQDTTTVAGTTPALMGVVAPATATGTQAGNLVQAVATTAAPAYTTATINQLSMTTAGGLRQDISSVGGSSVALGSAVAASSIPVVLASNQTAADPCMFQAKTNVTISTASGTTNLVTGVSAKKVYVCSVVLVAATAVSVSLSEGSATLCATSAQAGVLGVATNGTAANGIALVANGGITLGNGGGTIASTATAANYLCLFQSGTAQISGNLTYVQQ